MKALLTCCCLLLCCCLPLQVKGQVEAGSSQPHLPLSPDAQISNDSMNQYLQFLMDVNGRQELEDILRLDTMGQFRIMH